MHPTSSFAVKQHGAHVAAPPGVRKGSGLNVHLRTPSAPIGNGRKANKRTRVDSPLNSVSSDQSQLAELARGSHGIKMAHLEMKQKKMELRIEQERERHQLAAQERALVIKQKMQESEFAHNEVMAQYELKIAQLKGGQPSSANTVGLEQSTSAFPSCLDTSDHSSFSFGTGAASAFPLSTAAWGLTEPPAPQS